MNELLKMCEEKVMGNSEIKGINAYWVRARIRVRVSYALLYTKGQGTWKTVSIFLSDSIFGISYSVLLLFPSTLSSIWPGHLLALDWTGESP